MELSPLQRDFLRTFTKNPLSKKFYWTGGTLLSVRYLQHRISFDLDFFTNGDLNREVITRFVRNFAKKRKLKLEEHRTKDRLEFFIQNKKEVRIDFASYEYPAIHKRRRWRGINVDSCDDIAANKVVALMDRDDPKDIFDLYCLCVFEKYTIDKLLNLVLKKFSLQFTALTILSRADYVAKGLSTLVPHIIHKKGKVRKNIRGAIQKWIRTESDRFLDRNLND